MLSRRAARRRAQARGAGMCCPLSSVRVTNRGIIVANKRPFKVPKMNVSIGVRKICFYYWCSQSYDNQRPIGLPDHHGRHIFFLFVKAGGSPRLDRADPLKSRGSRLHGGKVAKGQCRGKHVW